MLPEHFFNGNQIHIMKKPIKERGFFTNLKPEKNVLKGIKKLIKKHEKSFEFYTLTNYSKVNSNEQSEKNILLEKYIPEIPRENRLFVPEGESMEDYIPNGIQITDVLVDDYAENLNKWKGKGGIGVQVLNGKNNDDEKWSGAKIDCRLDSLLFSYQLKYFVVDAVQDKDEFEWGDEY